MANLVAVLATTHHPFFYRASTAPPESRPDFADEWVRKVLAYRETLTWARPDVLVMVGSDHFHQLFYDNMPQFLIGKAPFYDANYYNEEREFGLPRMVLKGHEELSAYLLRAGLDAGFDFAFSNELRVDHSITCPIITTRPQADLPIVPIYTNIFAPPLPRPWRFVELGRTLRRLIEAWPSDQRVAVIGTGHLSLELGGPRQFGPHGPDPEFDRKAVEWIANGDIEGALREVTLESLWTAGQCHARLPRLHADDGCRRRNSGRLRRSLRPVPHDGSLLHLVSEGSGRMSKYLLNKFLFTIDRDPELVERYREDPRGTVTWWEAERANVILNLPEAERSTWQQFTDEEREALATHDFVKLFELGAHNFLTLTLFIALFERDYEEPLGFQLEYARKLQHWSLPYPDITT